MIKKLLLTVTAMLCAVTDSLAYCEWAWDYVWVCDAYGNCAWVYKYAWICY